MARVPWAGPTISVRRTRSAILPTGPSHLDALAVDDDRHLVLVFVLPRQIAIGLGSRDWGLELGVDDLQLFVEAGDQPVTLNHLCCVSTLLSQHDFFRLIGIRSPVHSAHHIRQQESMRSQQPIERSAACPFPFKPILYDRSGSCHTFKSSDMDGEECLSNKYSDLFPSTFCQHDRRGQTSSTTAYNDSLGRWRFVPFYFI